jgi:serine/threonine protein kinase/tetratricopeptide (TPR) repeat protein
MHPREFGKYRIVKLLPLGGMGRVYLAFDTEANEQIALKLIEQGPHPDQQEIVEAERRGAALQSRLCGIDRRIVLIRSFGELDGFFFIEMEYVEGEDLSELLRKGPLGVPFAARIARDICEVLHHAHNFEAEIEGHQYRGIVHGDIKPRNIRITPHGEVKVLDFGIAKALSLTHRFTQNHFGSSQYSSPERLNTGDVDVASDLWSVGVVMYEIVTGKPFFEGESGAKLEYAIRNYRTVRPLPPHLPAPFQAILRRALHPDPSLRYTTARDFADDLTAFLDNRPTVAGAMLGSDEDQTRRTTPVEDDAATRRTAVPVRPRLQPPQPVKAPLTRRDRQVRFFAGIGLAIVMFLLFFNEYTAWSRGHALTRDLETEKLTDMNVAWQRYESIAKGSFLPLVLMSPRSAIRNRLTAAADRVIEEYRSSDAPTVSENDWVRARESLARALELNPGDNSIRGRIKLCDGHLSRIRGTARGSSKLLNDARMQFEDAAELMSKSPDPYLGLARLYVYSLKDVDKAQDALRTAGKRGHDSGRREKAQLADGFRDRAERLLREADRITGMPEEKDYLERSEKDFERAEELYRDIVPFAGSAASLRRVLDFKDHVELRLRIIREGA